MKADIMSGRSLGGYQITDDDGIGGCVSVLLILGQYCKGIVAGNTILLAVLLVLAVSSHFLSNMRLSHCAHSFRC